MRAILAARQPTPRSGGQTSPQRLPIQLGAKGLPVGSVNVTRAEVMRQRCAQPTEDVRELWRRLVFNLLITNTDDHLHNLGFLYAGAGHWQLAPAFDLNPMPGKLRESKTWLTEDTGPIDTLDVLLSQSTHFELNRAQALRIVSEVLGAVRQWRQVGAHPEVGLTPAELATFEDAFEHPQTQAAQALTDG